MLAGLASVSFSPVIRATVAPATRARAVVVNDFNVATLVSEASPQQLLLAGSLVLGTAGVMSRSGGKPDTAAKEQKLFQEKIAMLKREGTATIERRAAIAAGPGAGTLVGKVTPVEAVKATPVDAAMSVETVFEQADKDGSGSVDMDELKEALEEAGRPADDESVRETMEALDTNNDGVLSLDELRAAPRQLAWWETDRSLQSQKKGASIGSW